MRGWARDLSGRNRDETRDAKVRDRDVEHFVRDRDETLVRLETVSRPRRRDRDHIPAIMFIIYFANFALNGLFAKKTT